MKYYSTEGRSPAVSLREAVLTGLAPDRGLYMPERIPRLPDSFFREMSAMSFPEVAFRVAEAFFGEDVPAEDLRRIVTDTLSFDCPAVPVTDRIASLELFHGPTLAFKDVGARFMARLLAWSLGGTLSGGKTVDVLVATSGDTGSAVANGFLGVEGCRVFVLYPKGRVTPVQKCQFTTLGRNITALEVDGSFDDCQALVKAAFLDADLRGRMCLTSANSINVARFLPQAFYYFWGYAQMARRGLADRLVVCVPSGNFGNLCAALFAARAGLPVRRFIAANNRNDVFLEYLRSGVYTPRESVTTLANAMDVGAPSNFARILDLYGGDWERIRADISGFRTDDPEILATIRDCLSAYGYLLDPHGACAFRALSAGLQEGETGLFCETAHPAKFPDTVARALGRPDAVPVPERLQAFMAGRKQSVPMPAGFDAFKAYLLSRAGA